MSLTSRRALQDSVVIGLTTVATVVALFPIFWMVLGSVRPVEEVLAYPPTFTPATISRWPSIRRSSPARATCAGSATRSSHLPDAGRHALTLAQAMWDRRDEFTFDQEVAESVDAAIDLGLSASQSSVFLTDSGDNPTAGTPGDSTYFLSRLLARQVPDAVLASIPDAEATRICFEAGEGATVTVSLGGKWDKTCTGPLELTGRVEHLHHGDIATGDSPMATLQVGGIHIILTGIRKSFRSLDDFRDGGLDALAHKLVVVKLGYLMPALRDAAPREILALSPGYADMQLERLPFRYVTRPIFPLDRDFTWQARVSNVAGFGV
jgi:microcystin degradation protein MlrC